MQPAGGPITSIQYIITDAQVTAMINSENITLEITANEFPYTLLLTAEDYQ